MDAQIEILLHTRRRQQRHGDCLEDVIGLMRQGRRLGRMVVAGDHQHATMTRAAGGIGMAEHVAATIDARALAVPEREDAGMAGAGEQIDLLATPYGSGGEIFIDARLEHDVVRLQVLARFPQCLVEAAERRAAIAGNEAGSVESSGGIAFALHQQQAHQRLAAGQGDAAGGLGVAIVERLQHRSKRTAGDIHRLSLLVVSPDRRIRWTAPRELNPAPCALCTLARATWRFDHSTGQGFSRFSYRAGCRMAWRSWQGSA